jgi:hypothetical protein
MDITLIVLLGFEVVYFDAKVIIGGKVETELGLTDDTKYNSKFTKCFYIH